MIVGIHVKKDAKKGYQASPYQISEEDITSWNGPTNRQCCGFSLCMAQPSPRRDVDRGAVETQQEVYGFLLVADSS